MYKNDYRSAMQKVRASDEWKAATLAKMQAAEAEKDEAQPPVQKQIRFPARRWLGAAAAACVCIAAVSVFAAQQLKPAQPSATLPGAFAPGGASSQALQQEEEAEALPLLMLAALDTDNAETQAVWHDGDELARTLPVTDADGKLLGNYPSRKPDSELADGADWVEMVYAPCQTEDGTACRVPVYRYSYSSGAPAAYSPALSKLVFAQA